jgi:hypothetical protein
MKELIPTFPRYIAFPERKLIRIESDFYKLINKFNGIKNIYYSIYEWNEENWWHFDKIFFDFDGENAFKEVKIFHNRLNEIGYKHLILFSGKKGFHLYLFLKNYERINNMKDALKNANLFFIKQLNIHPDEAVIGDIARIARVPNTYHITGKRYCIPLSENDLNKSLDEIKEMAKQQNFKFDLFGEVLFDISQFDYENVEIKDLNKIYPELKSEIKIEDKLINKFPQFFKMILLNPQYATYDNRYWFAIFCREEGIHPTVCDKIAKKYWSNVKEKSGRRSKYEEFKVEALKYAYKDNKFLPNWILDTMTNDEKKRMYREVK